MIPNKRLYRILLRIGFKIVSFLAPFALGVIAVLFSVVYTNAQALQHLDGGIAGWFLLAWLAAEAGFWIMSICASKAQRHRPQCFRRVTPTAEERSKLWGDTRILMSVSAQGGRRLIEGWFLNGAEPAVLEDIRRGNIRDWLCWAFFNRNPHSEYTPSEAVELETYLEELCQYIRERYPGAIPNGRNPRITCIRLTLDPIRAEHRPLAFYMIVWLLQSMLSLLFRIHGFRYAHQDCEKFDAVRLGYWHRPPTFGSNLVGRPSLVIIHGIGSVLSLTNFVIAISGIAQDRHIVVLDLPHISMRLPHPSRFPAPEMMTTQILNIVDRICTRGGPAAAEQDMRRKVVVFGHSFGSVLSVWMMKHAPERLAGIVLCDPVSVLLQLPDVAYNFLYRRPRTAAEIFFEWISRERGVAMSLARHFHWFENVFLTIEADIRTDTANPVSVTAAVLSSPVMAALKERPNASPVDACLSFFPRHIQTEIFLSGHDCIVPAADIKEILIKGREDNVRVHWMDRLDHGSFLFRPKWLRSVATATANMT